MAGSKMLKTVAILWIVFGVLSLIVNGIELASLFKMSLAVKSFWIPVVLGSSWAVVQVLAGFVGVKNWNRPEKARLCQLAATVTILCCVIYNACMMVYGYMLWPIISVIAGVLVAVVYLKGASYNNKLNA